MKIATLARIMALAKSSDRAFPERYVWTKLGKVLLSRKLPISKLHGRLCVLDETSHVPMLRFTDWSINCLFSCCVQWKRGHNRTNRLPQKVLQNMSQRNELTTAASATSSCMRHQERKSRPGVRKTQQTCLQNKATRVMIQQTLPRPGHGPFPFS